MTNKCQNPNDKKYDLVERTSKFGEFIIDFSRKIPKSTTTISIIEQFVRAGTAIGALYMEADCAESKRDFRHKIALCKKEAKETTYWARMIARACPHLTGECRVLWKEAHELTLIFSSIIESSKKNKK
ncbi:four helix bundle protein [Patescibacteria group bacterium]|nr:four helix bundle protein [Patescibacteria group bacterium]